VSYAAPYWATLHPIKLCCTLLSYAEPYLSYALHPKSYAALFWATLHPSELRCTLLSYDLPFWATLDPNELCWTLIELRCTLKKYISPPPSPVKLQCTVRSSWVGRHTNHLSSPCTLWLYTTTAIIPVRAFTCVRVLTVELEQPPPPYHMQRIGLLFLPAWCVESTGANPSSNLSARKILPPLQPPGKTWADVTTCSSL
jgi:hypothetical protein